MGSVMNGMLLHGGWQVYGGTFLIFSDYFKPSIRLAAMMAQPAVYVLTHDSIFLGEDGPSHQPIEQLAGLRAIPNLSVIRPADATETAEAWLAALAHRHGPTGLVLTRQALPTLDRSRYAPAAGLHKGAYTIWEQGGAPDIILIGSGSELAIALEAGQALAKDGVKVRVVSMPSWDLFEKQTAEYRESVLPLACARRVAVEAACTMGWERYVGSGGRVVGLNHFGASAPAKVLAEKFGFTAANVLGVARELLAEKM